MKLYLGRQLLLAAIGLLQSCLALGTETLAKQTECVGYYQLELPGRVEYPGMPLEFESVEGRGYRFDDRLGTAPVRIEIDDSKGSDGGPRTLQITPVLGQANLIKSMQDLNATQLKSKQELLQLAESARQLDARQVRDDTLEKAAAVQFYRPYRNHTAYAIPESESLKFAVLLGDRAVITRRKALINPEATIADFLKYYRRREPFEVPQGAGVCTPYGFVTGEKSPARIAVAIRLLDRPDIVVYLDMLDASEDEEADHRTVFNKMAYPNSGLLYDIVESRPANRLKPFFEVEMDGRVADATIALVTRASGSESHHVNNPATNNIDWAYLAYLPGERGGKPGDSFSLRFVVERFGKYAKKPMTEKEFRELATAIAASIKRRPGAWVVRN